jgi:hypothetical protein
VDELYRIKRLPPYVLATVTELGAARARGEGHVGFALVENERRIRQAVRGIRSVRG